MQDGLEARDGHVVRLTWLGLKPRHPKRATPKLQEPGNRQCAAAERAGRLAARRGVAALLREHGIQRLVEGARRHDGRIE